MRSVATVLSTLVFLAITSVPAWAEPSVHTVIAQPTQIPTGKRTSVKVTARITDPQLLMTANLYRVNANGTKTWLGLLNDLGLDGDFKPRDGIFTDAHLFNEGASTTIDLQVVVFYLMPDKKIHRSESPIVQVQAGSVLPPNAGTTVTGTGGVTLTVPPGALDYQAFVRVNTVPATEIVAPTTKTPVVRAVKIALEGVDDVGEPQQRLVLSVPAPPNTPEGTRFLVAQQIVFETVKVTSDGHIDIGASTPQLMPVSTAMAIGPNIVTVSDSTFPGIQRSGTYAIVEAPGSGFVTGTVREGTTPHGGVIVSNSSNALVTLTDLSGHYGLFISGMGQFTLAAFHPLRGSAAADTVDIVVDGATVAQDLDLVALDPPVNVRPGIRNGGFERRNAAGCELTGWSFEGAAEAVPQLGPTLPINPLPDATNPGTNGPVPVAPHPGNVTILPTEGRCMAMIDTGGPVNGSSLKQVFTVPAGATILRLDYNYVSEELPEWVGSQFQDPFRVLVTAGGVQTEIAAVTVNTAPSAPGFELIGDCNFGGGDNTCGQTGWRTASVNLAAYAGQTVTIQLLFTVTDVGDSIYDTRVLVDNVRFSTIWLDVKTLVGVSTQGLASVSDRVERDVRHMNEILSQAGLNARIRSNVAVSNSALLIVSQASPHSANPGPCSVVNGVDGVPLTNLHLEPEEVTLMNFQKSAVATDVNIYYVQASSVGGNIRGWSANPGDFCQEVSIATNLNWGALVTDTSTQTSLTHELGHALITAISASGLIHTCASADGTCFTISGAPVTAIVTPLQSQAINTSIILSP